VVPRAFSAEGTNGSFSTTGSWRYATARCVSPIPSMALNLPCTVCSRSPAQNAAVLSAVRLEDISQTGRMSVSRTTSSSRPMANGCRLALKSDDELYSRQYDIRSRSPAIGF
jgi:hypothetical protein